MEDAIKTGIYQSASGRTKGKVHLIRYADDFIISSDNKETLKGTILENCHNFLEERNLRLQNAKTKITDIEAGFDFLGFHIQRYQRNPVRNQPSKNQGTVLIIKPRSGKTQKLRDKIKKIVQITKPLEKIIQELNPILRGWAEYYRISYHSQEVFGN